MTVEEIAKMMDISAVQAQSTREDIDACCEMAREFGVAAVMIFAYIIAAIEDTIGAAMEEPE